ncbi:hypothetical protein EGM87_01020 [Sphingobium sp. RSMS]|uniref:hypothetical protein n=1 Tax=Sphingobium sp. RSMS TaxID=520734 RepID=UPI0010F6F7C5|nr:hypothetical protein [Sphingobium sp. RSMS]UXC91105.1 hypothetical protein EGM87_01020 [Sphingobium sp. RSMS]
MKRTGIILIAVGAALFLYAMLIFDTSVAVGSYGGYGGGRVVNIGLQQQQTMMAIAGAALFIGGIVLYGMSFAMAANVSQDTHENARPAGEAPISRKTYSEEELADLGVMSDGNSYHALGKTFQSGQEAANHVRMERIRSKLS